MKSAQCVYTGSFLESTVNRVCQFGDTEELTHCSVPDRRRHNLRHQTCPFCACIQNESTARNYSLIGSHFFCYRSTHWSVCLVNERATTKSNEARDAVSIPSIRSLFHANQLASHADCRKYREQDATWTTSCPYTTWLAVLRFPESFATRAARFLDQV